MPITTIYILGFPLPGIETSALQIKREYYDLIHKKTLDIKTDFVEKLTHDSFIILIRQLPPKERTELEGVLQVFNQSFQLSSDYKLLEIKENELYRNELTNKMLARLRNGATDEEILQQIWVEDEIETVIDQHVREVEELKEQTEKLDEKIKFQDEKIKKQNQIIKQRQLIKELKNRSYN